jgi:leucine dehydrogenase
MSSEIFEGMRAAGAHRLMLLNDPESGLRAVIALDSLDLGPAVGGVRTRAYASDLDATSDAAALARAMTLKCAIAGLDAGGGKTVVEVHPEMDRTAAFRRLGRYVQDLGGLYRCAGDLGTTAGDLAVMAGETEYVNTGEVELGQAAARGVSNCIRACARHAGRDGLAGLRVVVQGCGSMGAATARELAREGAHVAVCDIDEARARGLADEIGGEVIAPEEALLAQADVIAPCAAGGVITEAVARDVRAWAVCGAANNQLVSAEAGRILAARGVLFVPDFVSSAGAVIAGVAPGMMGADPAPLVEALEATARHILERAGRDGQPPTEVAEAMALERIAHVRAVRRA